MIIAGIDRLESGKQQQRYIRNEAIRRQTTPAKAKSPEPSTSSSTNMEINDIDSNYNDDVTSDDSDPEMFVNTPKKTNAKAGS